MASGHRRAIWYAWRGGPQILSIEAPSDAALDREIAKALPVTLERYKAERQPQADGVTFHGLVTRYLIYMDALPEDVLSPRTKSDRRKYLDVARRDLGDMEVRAFESSKARPLLLRWRAKYGATAKTADARLGAVSTVLQWAVDNGDLKSNPIAEFKRLYKTNRADIIWEAHHQAIILDGAAPEFVSAFDLAAHTALRESDLVRLPKNAIGKDAIVWQTGKSRGRRTIVIPMTSGLRRVLKAIPPHSATTVLASSRGRPWTISGLAAALRRQRLHALEQAQAREGEDAKTGVEGLRWHDLRGTAATNFILDGLPVEDVALILGWEKERVQQIAARYVSGEAMGRAMVLRLKRNAKKTKAVNDAVNDGA